MVTGAADEPVLLYAKTGRVEIRSANEYQLERDHVRNDRLGGDLQVRVPGIQQSASIGLRRSVTIDRTGPRGWDEQGRVPNERRENIEGLAARLVARTPNKGSSGSVPPDPRRPQAPPTTLPAAISMARVP
ncbi:MAG: hypothetical protein ACYC6T_15250 [Thermoleophilia bacterium]